MTNTADLSFQAVHLGPEDPSCQGSVRPIMSEGLRTDEVQLAHGQERVPGRGGHGGPPLQFVRCGLVRLDVYVATTERYEREVGANAMVDQPVVVEDRDRVGIERTWR